MDKNKLSVALALMLLGSSTALAAPTDQQVRDYHESGMNDAGVVASRTRDYLERQRIAQQIQEDRERETSRVETEREKTDEQQAPAVKFTLKKINIDKSEVLDNAAIDVLKADYIGREIELKDIYELVNKINELYSEQGYLTCRAVLPAQTIHAGEVKIDLIEGKTGAVNVQGNKYTYGKYITNRLGGLKKGTVASINRLNDDLLHFNGTNDVQLRIMLQAGTEPGTTDYVITAYEPQNILWTVYGDNSGSTTSGEYRAGLFFTDRSLTGVRDTLSMSTLLSDGTKTFGAGYTRPIGRSGTKLNVQFSTNSVHITDGPLEALGVRGHAYSASLGVIVPTAVTEKRREELTLDYTRQNSKTDFASEHWLDDTIKGATLGYAITDYGTSSIVYQRHALTTANYANIAGEDSNLSLYQLSGLYQKIYGHGQLLSLRLDAQRGFNNYLPSAKQFYIGGAYSVRGYKESLLSGDSGYSLGLEYSMPLGTRTVNGFLFLDHGSVYGDSAFDDHQLTSCGVGVRATIAQKISGSLTLGIPLVRELNGTTHSKTRLHFVVSGQF